MMIESFKKLGQRLSLGHHSQGLLVVAAVFFILIKSWWSLPGLVLYGIMHFQYGGSGTFQRTPRCDDQKATLVDVVYVLIGLVGLALMLAGITKRLLQAYL
jgi:hypothetical protein